MRTASRRREQDAELVLLVLLFAAASAGLEHAWFWLT